jgi:murein DD-endopeptidase MepM/ murein hydrolase activator NlpD
MRRYLSSCVVLGAIVFVLDVSNGQDVPAGFPDATLMGSSTGAMLLAQEPFVNPFGTKKPRIVSGFGKRNIPNQPMPEMHEGVDYAAPAGTLVRAARSGKVIFAGFSKMYASRMDKTDQNRFVIIRHADGKSSRYVHLNVLRVKPGQEVQSGQPIGVLAESDEWTEPVLHFEIRDVQGHAVDPKIMITDFKRP